MYFRCLLVAAFISFLLVSGAVAGVPRMINYQGKITTPQGALIDTIVSITFTIYAGSEGISDGEWVQEFDSVKVEKGIFSVLLGSNNPIPDSVFDGGVRYLGVKVGDDPEMTPRKTIASVAYAYRAGIADAGSGGSCGWVDDGTVVRLEANTDSIGIGTTTPSEKLHIGARGNILLSATGLYPQEHGIIMGDPVGLDTDFWLGRIADGDLIDDDLFQIGKGTVIAANPVVTINRDGNVGIGTETPGEKLEVEWVSGGTDVEIGRGTSDTDITFIALRSPNGAKWYVYPDDSGNLVVTTTHP